VLETLAAWVETRRPQRPARNGPALPPEPYKLLSYYGREDAALYFGRDREVAELTDALDQPRLRLLSVFGPCGIGKSSLLGPDSCPPWIRSEFEALVVTAGSDPAGLRIWAAAASIHWSAVRITARLLELDALLM